MDDFLRCLGDAERLRVLQLLREQPRTQAELGREIARTRGVRRLNPGSTSRLLEPLFDAGLIRRPSPRGMCSLSHPEATNAALRAIGQLVSATAETQEDRARAARELGSELLGGEP